MKQIAVIGLGTFGLRLAKLLAERGAEVIAVDSEMERVEEIKDVVSAAVCLNASNERALRSQSLNEVDAAVVCIGENFQANILATVLLKKIGVKTVFSRATNSIERQILREVGATEVINPEEDMAREMAMKLTSKNLIDLIPLAPNMSALKLKAPKSFLGKTLAELQLRKNYEANIVAMYESETDDPHNVTLPKPDSKISEGQTLLVIGYEDRLSELANLE